MRARSTLERKLVCTRHQIRSVTTTVFHVFGRTPKPAHDRHGNASDADLHAFARCPLPRNCVDAVTAAQTFSVKNAIRFENKLLQPMAKWVLVLGTKSGASFGDMCFATPRAQYYIPNINKTWNHIRSLDWGHVLVPKMGTSFQSLLCFLCWMRQFWGRAT